MAVSKDYFRECLERRCLERGCLERKLARPEYQTLLESLQVDHPFFHSFATWSEVLGFMNERRRQDLWEDQILRPIFQAYQQSKDPRWQEVLLAIFWPKLELIRRWKHHWGPKVSDNLWQNIQCAFLRTVERIDVDQRRERLVQKIQNDIIHHVYEGYERTKLWEKRHSKQIDELPTMDDDDELPTMDDDDDELATMDDDDPYKKRNPLYAREPAASLHRIKIKPLDPDTAITAPDLVGTELRDAQQAAVQWLTRYKEIGRISEDDFSLYVECKVYGKEIEECARKRYLNYETAKKRCQRVHAKIWRFVTKGEKGARSCPPASAFPPFYIENLMLEK